MLSEANFGCPLLFHPFGLPGVKFAVSVVQTAKLGDEEEA